MIISRREALLLGAACAISPVLPAGAREVARLGERLVLSLSDGGFDMPAGMAARDRSAEELARVLGPQTGPSRSVLNVTLIKDGADYTIFDCGSGANFMPGAGKLAESLSAAGVDPDKVTRVLFTHAHPDHLWGAIDDFDSPLFPNARWFMPEAEMTYWTSPEVFKSLPDDRHAFAAGAQNILRKLGDRIERFKPGQEIAPGVMAVDTSGHTPGHVAFEIAGGNASLMVLGDALTHPVVSFAHPEWKPASDHDADKAIATRKRLLDRLATGKLPVIGYHLPTPGLGRVEKDGLAYRYVAG